MSKQENYYIAFLKYACEKMTVGEGTVDYSDIFKQVSSIHPMVSEPTFKRTFLQAVVPVIYQGRAAHEDDIANGNPLVLTLEAYFQLLEHEELEEARRASQRAESHAFRAIVVAVVLGLLTLVFSINEHFNPNMVIINTNQVETFQEDMQEFIREENDRLRTK